MKILDDYFKLQKDIYSYFGYTEDYRVIPIDDCRKEYWYLHQEENGSGQVYFGQKEHVEKLTGNNYSSEIYTQRFLPKWVYRGEEYTMICTDPHVDGNKFLSIFSNDLELKTINKKSQYWGM